VLNEAEAAALLVVAVVLRLILLVFCRVWFLAVLMLDGRRPVGRLERQAAIAKRHQPGVGPAGVQPGQRRLGSLSGTALRDHFAPKREWASVSDPTAIEG
jgi:hypothetical protein